MSLRRRAPLLLAFALQAIAAAAAPAADLAELERSFKRPPDDSRIMMRWWWFGPAVTRPELEREMRLMKEGGIGGFEVQPVYPLALDDAAAGIKNLEFLSPEFLAALGFTAAKAKELGLRFDLTLGSGWPYGGPMFPIGEAAGRLRFQSVRLSPGQSNVPVPPLREGETLVAAFLITPVADAAGPYRELEIRDRAAQLPAEGNTDEQGVRQVLFCVAGHTGMKVKRPAVGAEGFVIDHYDRRVVDKFLADVAEPELKACAATPPYAVFCDSLEVGGEDWTGSFLTEFQKRRSYDLRPFLPALAGEDNERNKDIRHDWGKTLTELFVHHFLTPLENWSQDHSTRLRIQGYGTPPAALYCYEYADLNEAEGHLWKEFEESRWAASASHLLGRPVTSSETWTWLHSPVFRATPLDMKAEADLHFLQGINQLIGHGWPYTPPGIGAPGWRFYAAAVFNEKNPWWIVMPDVARYLQRVSFVLRQGRPANDVALYLPNSDAWARFAPGRVSMNATLAQCLGRDVVRRIIEAGYNLDFFDDPLLAGHGKVVGGSLSIGRGVPRNVSVGGPRPASGRLAFGEVGYRVVVLPGVERMPLATLQTLDRFARAGGIVIATRRLPARAPGFQAPAADHEAVRSLAQDLFEGPDARGVYLPSEDALGASIVERLRPDMACSPPAPDLGFVHRSHEAGEIYFVANTSNVRQSVRATFRVAGMEPEWWNPLSGQTEAAQVLERSSEGTTVAVDLDAYGSQVLVFTRRNLPARPAPASVPVGPPALDLSRDWSVSFAPDRPPVTLEALRSWTEDGSTRHFSGVATYEKRVQLPEAMLAPGLRIAIDFGIEKAIPAPPQGRMQALVEAPVREAAVVYVNGRRAGSVWCPPYRLDITNLLQHGENQIKVEVANLALNEMAGHPLPDYSALKARFGDRFQPQDMNLVEPIAAGLLGSIRLVAQAQPPRP
jgi:hypothetical protein